MSEIQNTRGLNPEQKNAVETLSGPLLILAGAGSGKTKTLTHRIANLVAHGIPPHQILAVTFTNKAASEMKERITKLVDGHVRFPYIGTFHSICVRILRIEYEAAGLDKNFVIYDTDDQQTLIKRLMKQLDIDSKSVKPKVTLSVISKCKTENTSPAEYAATAYYPHQKHIAKLYEAYEAAKTASGAVDFDDLLLLVDRLFTTNPTVLQHWQDKIKHILVDEYQDTNHTQYSIIKALAEKSQNICVVGDDWQSIYSWRGADFTNILNFESDFKGAKVIKLERNYRSTGNILKISQQIINQNQTRTDKTLFTEASDGSPIQIYQAYDEADEANRISRKIYDYISPLYYSMSNLSIDRPESQAQAVRKSYTFSDIAILYRTNAQSYPFEKALISAKIPYKLVGGMRFYDRREIKDVLAILKLMVNPADRVSLERVIKNVISGIGEASFAKILFTLDNLPVTSEQSFLNPLVINALSARAGKQLARLADFVKQNTIKIIPAPTTQNTTKIAPAPTTEQNTAAMNADDTFSVAQNTTKISSSANPAPATLIQSILTCFDFAKLLSSDPTTEEERMKNLEVMIGNAATYESLDDFLADAALMSSADDRNSENVVTLSTLHASKGLEFPIVFMVGMEEGLFPSPQAEAEGNIEEERRLAYVGMTRAMDDLILTYARSRFTFGGRSYHEPSRFLLEVGYHPSAGTTSLLGSEPTADTSIFDSDLAGNADSTLDTNLAGNSNHPDFFSNSESYDGIDSIPDDDLPFFD